MTQQMPNPIELYETAAAGFRKAMSGVKAEQLSLATPCTEWSVQGLMNHNIKVTGFAHGVFTGSIQVDPFSVDEPLPSEGALTAFDRGVAQVLEEARKPGVLEKTHETPFGPMLGAHFMMAPIGDLLIHRWDLAKGTSQDKALDQGLVEVCHAAYAEQWEGMREMGFFQAAVAVPENASLQDRLLGASGRQP